MDDSYTHCFGRESTTWSCELDIEYMHGPDNPETCGGGHYEACKEHTVLQQRHGSKQREEACILGGLETVSHLIVVLSGGAEQPEKKGR